MGKRRRQGDGSICQRQDGRWVAVLDLGYVGGKRKRKYFYGHKEREVREKLARAQRDLENGVGVGTVDERLSVEQYLQRWLTDVVQPTRRPATYTSYAEQCRLHIIPALGRHRLQKLTPLDVQAFLNAELQAGKLAPKTIRYHRAILRRALEQALQWGMLPRNVAALVPGPRGTRRHEVEPLSVDEALRFLAGIKGDRWEALYVAAVALGLRRGEVCGLRWQDIDLTPGLETLTARGTLSRVKGKGLVWDETKTARSTRTVALPAFVAAAFHEQHTRQLAERMAAAPGTWRDTGYVFTMRDGAPVDGVRAWHELKQHLARLGIPHRSFHATRHTAATLLNAMGVDLSTIMAILGHTRSDTTLGIYVHASLEQQRAAMAKMDDLLGGASAGASS